MSLPKEEELVGRLAALFGTRRRDVRLAIGDDAAVVRAGAGDLVLTNDFLVQGEDFMADADPRRLGRKALGVNLADLAAMGATPLWALLSLALPRDSDMEWFEAFAQGVKSMAAEFGVAIVGGDLSAAPIVFASVAAIGRVHERSALRRDGARAGDDLYVSGTLGAAAAGLALLGAGYRLLPDGGVKRPKGRRVAEPQASDLARLIRHQVDPRPPLALGHALAEGRLATAAIDVSDGFARDLHRLCRASGVAARVEASSLPADSTLAEVARLVRFDARAAVLFGGEDYGLLFTAPARKQAALERLASRFGFRRIGSIHALNGAASRVRLAGESGESALPEAGFDHFEPRSG